MGEETARIREEIESLRQMTTAQLKEKCRELFGEESRSNVRVPRHVQGPAGFDSGFGSATLRR
jgi:hypothetical protein